MQMLASRMMHAAHLEPHHYFEKKNLDTDRSGDIRVCKVGCERRMVKYDAHELTDYLMRG